MGRGLDQTSTKVVATFSKEKERNVKEEPNADKTRRKLSRFNEVEQWCNEHGKKVVRLKRTPGICSSAIKDNLKRE